MFPMLRVAVATATTVALMVTISPRPAEASSMYFSRSSGTVIFTSWLEVGELPPAANAAGNAHFGDLWVEDLGRGRVGAFGTVYDVQCAQGVTPYLPWGGHGEPSHEPPGDEPPAEEGCELVGVRSMKGASLQLKVDRKLAEATLTGTLSVGSGHGEGPVGTPPVNITWNGVGSLYKSSESGRSTDGDGRTFSYRYTFSGRDAQIGGGSRIGPMVFDDEPGEHSTGQLGRYSRAYRERS